MAACVSTGVSGCRASQQRVVHGEDRALVETIGQLDGRRHCVHVRDNQARVPGPRLADLLERHLLDDRLVFVVDAQLARAISRLEDLK